MFPEKYWNSQKDKHDPPPRSWAIAKHSKHDSEWHLSNQIISLRFWVKVLYRLHPRRNVSAIKSFFVHANRTSIMTWRYSSLLPWSQLPDKYPNASALNPLSVGRGTGLSFNPESYTALLWLTVSWTHEEVPVWPSMITCTMQRTWEYTRHLSERESIPGTYLNAPALDPLSVSRTTGLSFIPESYTAWLTASWTHEQHQEVWPSTINALQDVSRDAFEQPKGHTRSTRTQLQASNDIPVDGIDPNPKP